MVICESKDKCKQKDCFHIKPHDVNEEGGSYCLTNPCDPMCDEDERDNYCSGSVCVDEFIFKMRKALEKVNADM